MIGIDGLVVLAIGLDDKLVSRSPSWSQHKGRYRNPYLVLENRLTAVNLYLIIGGYKGRTRPAIFVHIDDTNLINAVAVEARSRRRYRADAIGAIQRRTNKGSIEPKLDVKPVQVAHIVPLEVVAIDNPIAHQGLCLSQPRHVVIQPQNLALREDGENLLLAKLDGIVGVVRQSRVSLIYLLNDADDIVIHLLEQDVDTLDYRASRAYCHIAHLNGVDHTLVEVRLGGESEWLALEDGSTKL